MENSAQVMIDNALGMFISNLFYEEGIRVNNIASYSDQNLLKIISNFENSRLWHSSGYRLEKWNSMRDMARNLMEQKIDFGVEREVVIDCSLILLFVALEERVNSFLQDCLIAINESNLKEEGITKQLKKNLDIKLNLLLKELTGHSLKEEKYELWKTFEEAKTIRNNLVHNKLLHIKFNNNQARIDNSEKITRAFLYTFSEIDEYLKSITPTIVTELDRELHQIWLLTKTRLNLVG